MADNTFDEVEQAWFTIDENFDGLYRAAPNDEARTHLRELRDSARDAYWRAVEDGLAAGDALVAKTRKELKEAHEELKRLIEEMEGFSQVVEALGQVVKLAAALVTLASV
jgi:hypothetical protein